ncbi:MAG: response regulator transcription factor [Bacteroidetes bacterium]|nr:response regulator transcription factor [Bacteroidota bacterium]
MSVNIFLVEDHDIVRQGIRALLNDESGITVVGEACNGAEALTKLKHLTPNVVLMDMNMPVMGGLECTRKLKISHPDLKVLVLSMHDHESHLIDMLDAGAQGYIVKNTSKDELVFAIKKVAGNGVYMGPEFTLNMLAKYKAASGFIGNTPKISIPITEREKDVLNLIAEGLTNTEMAQKLFTSVRTIETRRKNLLTKTGTTNTATLIKFAVLNGLVPH